MKDCIIAGERLFIVPGLQVYEPIPWNDIPIIIERATREVEKQRYLTNEQFVGL